MFACIYCMFRAYEHDPTIPVHTKKQYTAILLPQNNYSHILYCLTVSCCEELN